MNKVIDRYESSDVGNSLVKYSCKTQNVACA